MLFLHISAHFCTFLHIFMAYFTNAIMTGIAKGAEKAPGKNIAGNKIC